MTTLENIKVPERLPFLKAICWQLPNVKALTNEEKLNRYECGMRFDGVLGDLEDEELHFFKTLKASTRLAV